MAVPRTPAVCMHRQSPCKIVVVLCCRRRMCKVSLNSYISLWLPVWLPVCTLSLGQNGQWQRCECLAPPKYIADDGSKSGRFVSLSL